MQDGSWLPDGTQHQRRAALTRAIEEGMALAPEAVTALTSSKELLDGPNPHQSLHSIPLMAQAALALAAEVTGHSAKALLSRRFQCLFEAG